MEVVFPGLSSALNVHPLFVHFPIVLWLTALFFWGLALWLERDVLWDTGRWLLYLGALGALAAVGTGLWAEEHLGHDSPAHDLVHVHRNWMLSATALGLATAAVAFATRNRTTRGARRGLCGLLPAYSRGDHPGGGPRCPARLWPWHRHNPRGHLARERRSQSA